MPTPRLWPCLAGSLILSGACLRDTPDLPGVAEGGFLTGAIVERSAVTTGLEPRAGVRVQVSGLSRAVLTDDAGRFSLERLPLGSRQRLSFELRGEGGRVQAGLFTRVDLLVDGQSQDLGQLRIAKDAEIIGRVALAASDPGGASQTAPGAVVALPGTPFLAVDSGSGFRFPALPPGTFDLAAFFPGYAPSYRFDVAAESGRTALASDLVLEPLASTASVTINGQLRLGDRADASGVEVRWTNAVFEGRSPVAVTSDPDGAFAVQLVPGLYHVRMAREGWIPRQILSVVVLESGATLGLDPQVRLDPSPSNDVDADTLADDTDPDDDNDGCRDEVDQAPRDPTLCADTDGDGIDDREEVDADDDGLSNAEEASPGIDGEVSNPAARDSDGDGIIDALDPCPNVPGTSCPATSNPGLGTPLAVLSFFPTRGGQDDIVELTARGVAGTDLAFVRFGAGGASAPALAVTATSVAVRVPAGAQSGLLTLFANGQQSDAPGRFEVETRALIRRIEPQPAFPGTLLGVYVEGLEAGSVPLVGFDDLAPGPPETCTMSLLAAATGDESVVCTRVPAGAAALTLTVGSRSARAPITVVDGPQLTDLVPRQVAPGVPLRILGENLAADRSEVGVIFPGTGTPVTPTRVTNEEIVVEVPAAATGGLLTVRYPAGEVMVPVALTVAPSEVIAGDAFPTYLRAGDTDVEVYGSNLDQVTAIRLPDGTMATNLRTESTRLRFDVPVGFTATVGQLTLTTSSGSVMTTFGFGAIRQIRRQTFVSRATFGGRSNSIWAYDNTAFWSMDVGASAPPVSRPFVPGTGQVSIVPRSDFALRTTNVVQNDGTRLARIDLIDMTSLRTLAQCDLHPDALTTSRLNIPSPSHDAVYVVLYTGAVGQAVRLSTTGSCTTIDLDVPRAMNSNPFGADWLGNDLFFHGIFGAPTNGLGWARVNVDPSDTTPDGRVVSGPFGGLPLLQGRSEVAEPRTGGQVFVATATGLWLAGSQGNRQLLAFASSFSGAPQPVGGRYLIKQSDRDGCDVYDKNEARRIASLRPTAGSLQACIGVVPNPIAVLRLRDPLVFPVFPHHGLEVLEFLPPP